LTEFHMVTGLAVLVLFLLVTILNYVRMSRGRVFAWAKWMSLAAAGLLLLQYVVGFALLADDRRINALHYILALAVIIPIFAVDMLARGERSERDIDRLSFFASFAALLMVVIVYSIGDRSG